jgi:AcrR family transcriptional regulator
MNRRVRTTPRKKPRQNRSQTTVDVILDATAHVLVHEGYDRTSTNRVALRAGVSIGSIYQYFPNKEALVGELVDRYSRMVFEMVTQRFVTMATEPPEVVARAMVQAMVELKRTEPRLAKVLREQIPRVGRMQRYEQQLDMIVEATSAYLALWKDRLRHEDPANAAFFAVQIVDTATHYGVTQRDIEDVELIDHVTDMVLRYLLK